MFRTRCNVGFESLFERIPAEIDGGRPAPGVAPASCRGLFERVWNHPDVETLSSQRTSDVAVLRLDGSIQDEIFVCRKRYWYPNLRSRFKGLLRNTFFGMSRAHREFRNIAVLHAVECSIVRPVAWGEERAFRVLRRAFVVTEMLPRTRALDDVLRSMKSAAPPARRVLAARLGSWVRSLHDRGYSDRDLFGRNILVHGRAGELRFSKIDSGAASGGKLPPGSGRIYLRDLSDLDRDAGRLVSRPDRLRFLLAYLAAHRIDAQVRYYAEALAGAGRCRRNEPSNGPR